MKRSKPAGRFKVSADGKGIVSHAGAALLRELAAETGLVEGWTAALSDTYALPPTHAPGQVLADLAVTIADGGDALRHLRALRDQAKLFGPVASDPTAWRVVDKVDTARLDLLREARAAARARAWAAGAGPDLSDPATVLRLNFDASLLTAHSDKQNAAPTWKKGFGFHPLLCYLDRPDVSSGEALAGLLRPGNAGANTAADHITVLDLALAALPEHARPRADDPNGPQLLASADSAGATHDFAAALRAHGIGFTLGYGIGESAQQAILAVPSNAWTPAYNADGEPRRGAWVTEITDLLNLTDWPEGSRVIVRRERPHPGAQLTFSDIDGHRFTAFITDTPPGPQPGLATGQLADLEMRHRGHARVEDRIRCGKDTGLRNLPCYSFNANACWLELALTAADLLTWSQALCFTGTLAHVEPATFRYQILHTAARLVRTARGLHLRLDQDWPWAHQLATAFSRLRTAPWPAT
ncbi:IS1380 family transposase [Kribbella sp. NPDC050124]|uniref:IS1380 family transposase n=1 Tax=Kribbella sp. NPDC050124 TaxID=3364114 RepID=UPI0037B6BAA1